MWAVGEVAVWGELTME